VRCGLKRCSGLPRSSLHAPNSVGVQAQEPDVLLCTYLHHGARCHASRQIGHAGSGSGESAPLSAERRSRHWRPGCPPKGRAPAQVGRQHGALAHGKHARLWPRVRQRGRHVANGKHVARPACRAQVGAHEREPGRVCARASADAFASRISPEYRAQPDERSRTRPPKKPPSDSRCDRIACARNTRSAPPCTGAHASAAGDARPSA
jgi:hypothetical protein